MRQRYTVRTVQVRLRVSEAALGTAGSPAAAAEIARSIYRGLDANQEHFTILALDSKNHVTGYKVCASGGQDSTLVDPRIVFRAALLLGAVSLVVIHNHPSGDPKPSEEDRQLTRTLREAGELLGIRLLDHVILGDGTSGYASFAESGLL